MGQERTDQAIASIYSALLGERRWQDVVEAVASATSVDMATLFHHDTRGHRGALMLSSGIPDDVQRDYSSHFSSLNPWMSQIDAAPLCTGLVGEQVLERSELLRTEYYNDFLKPYEQESSVGVTVRHDDGCFFMLSVLSGDTDFERNRNRADQLTRIAPHMRRVSDFYRGQTLGPLGEGFAEELGEAGRIGVVVVNAAARVIHASPLGGTHLASGDTLGVDAAGRVSFRDSMAQSVFGHALKGRYLDLMTRRVTVGDAQITFVRAAQDHGSAIFMGGALAMLIASRGRDAATATQRVAAKYGLTPAEKRVFEGVVSGLRTAEIAGMAGVAKETVRSQLKAIYGKTGTNGQTALVRLAAGLDEFTDDGQHEQPRKRK